LVSFDSLLTRCEKMAYNNFSHKSCLVFFNACIHYILDLVYPFGGHCLFIFKSRHDFPYIILHDLLVLFQHFIFPNLLFNDFLIGRRFNINNIIHKFCITIIPLWPLAFLEGATWCCMSFDSLKVGSNQVNLFFISVTIMSIVSLGPFGIS